VFSNPSIGEHVIPLVPPILRRKNANGAVLLFEANDWQKPIVVYSGDPYLLQHIAGDIYTVLGMWEVTKGEIEAFRHARDLGIG
jgi:hypothetical protein